VTIVDVLLSSQTNADNPLMASQAKNRMVVQSLTTLPLDVFSKKERERIMKAWIQGSSQTRLSEQSYDLTSPDSQVLALKVKIMHRPSLYEVRNSKQRYFMTLIMLRASNTKSLYP